MVLLEHRQRAAAQRRRGAPSSERVARAWAAASCGALRQRRPSRHRPLASTRRGRPPAARQLALKIGAPHPVQPYHLQHEHGRLRAAPRVLVVEDDDEIAQVLQRSLRMEGYEVRIAGDGVSALDEAHAFLPDLVILDLGLPRLDGIDVAKTLRETRRRADPDADRARRARVARRGARRRRRRLPRQAVRAPGAARAAARAAAPPPAARPGAAARRRPAAEPRHARGRARRARRSS